MNLTDLERRVLLELANKGALDLHGVKLAAGRRLADRGLVQLELRKAKATDAGRRALGQPIAEQPRYLRAGGSPPIYPAGPGPHDDPTMDPEASRGYTGRREKAMTDEPEAVDDATLDQFARAALHRDQARQAADRDRLATTLADSLRAA